MIIAESDCKVFIKNVNLVVRKGVFNPDSNLTNSTLIILNNLEDIKDKDILDVGCGSGILGIYCALNGARKVICVDVDENAVKNTEENIIENKVEDIVKVKKSNLFDNVSGTYDIIFGNLPISDNDWDLDISTVDLFKKFLSQCANYIRVGGLVYVPWIGQFNASAIKEYLVKENYKFEELIEDRLNYKWHLFKIKF